jgi:hypothetical protein
MSLVAEALLAAYEPVVLPEWKDSPIQVLARFETGDFFVTVTFEMLAVGKWGTSKVVHAPVTKTATDIVLASISIYSGVFQCMLAFRADHPVALVCHPSDESLCDLWATYLEHPELIRQRG